MTKGDPDKRAKRITKRTATIHLPVVLATLCLLLNASESGASVQGDDHEQQRATLRSLLPAEGDSPDLKVSSGPRFFEPGNLWQYIDGEAAFYMQYGFRLVVTSEYALGPDSNPLVIEIYEMESPLHAFGIYAAERSVEVSFVDVGVQGYQVKGSLNFWNGPYYVKLSSFQASSAAEKDLLKLARGVAGRIPGSHSEPDLLTCLPERNKIKMSERYIPRDLLGHAFLTNGYWADYEVEGNSYRVFLVEDASTEETASNYGKYRSFLKSQGANISHERKGEAPSFRAGNGSRRLVFVYRTILGGVLDVRDYSEAEEIVDGIVGRLRERAGSSE
jgi:hypothetical protein